MDFTYPRQICNILHEAYQCVQGPVMTNSGCLVGSFAFDKGYTFLIAFGLPGWKQDYSVIRCLKSALLIQQVRTVAASPPPARYVFY